MDMQQLIDMTSESSQQSLLQYLKEHITDDQRKLFIESFYMTFFNTDNEFIVDGTKAMEWIGFSRKDNFVKALTKHLVEGQDWLSLQVAENLPQGGRPRIDYKLTVNGFKKLGMKANTERGNAIREYYIEVEKCLMKYALRQSMQLVAEERNRVQGLLEDRNSLLLEKTALETEIKTFRNTQVKPCIYIYDMDSRVPSETIKKSLKIGITENLFNRVKPYRQIAPYGRSVFSIDVEVQNLRTAENWLHMLLKPYCAAGEVFEMTIEEAKLWITTQVKILRMSERQNYTERYTALAKMADKDNGDHPKMSTSDAGTQTDNIEIGSVVPVISEQQIEIPVAETFNQFIEECCELHPDFEVATIDIIGQFRLWKRQAAKEIYHQCLEYLKTRFCPVRVKQADASNVVNGFRGVRLKAIDYRSVNVGSDYEMFLNHLCEFSPSGKILKSRLSEAYENWCKRNNKDSSSQDFISKLESCPHVLQSNVWTVHGGGSGYYGISLKTDEIRARKTSTNAKRVEKRTLDHVVVDTFSTIAKAAENEGIPPCNLSRIIKRKETFNGHYFVNV
jgi:phage anti-repressor protein